LEKSQKNPSVFLTVEYEGQDYDEDDFQEMTMILQIATGN